MYSSITNPENGINVSVHSKIGKNIIKNYMSYLTGGSPDLEKKIPTFRDVLIKNLIKLYEESPKEERQSIPEWGKIKSLKTVFAGWQTADGDITETPPEKVIQMYEALRGAFIGNNIKEDLLAICNNQTGGTGGRTNNPAYGYSSGYSATGRRRTPAAPSRYITEFENSRLAIILAVVGGALCGYAGIASFGWGLEIAVAASGLGATAGVVLYCAQSALRGLSDDGFVQRPNPRFRGDTY